MMENKIPPFLNNDNLQQLEIEHLVEKVRELLTTPYGLVPVSRWEVLHDPQVVKQRLHEVSEMVGLMEAGYTVPMEEMEDIRPLLERLKPEEAFLEAPELIQVKNNLQAIAEISRFLKQHREQCPLLYRYAERMHAHRALVGEIAHTIDPRGEVREDASPELRRIRREIAHLEHEQKEMLLRVLKRYSELTQDDIVTLRDGRLVLGIQQQYANKVNGIVHGTSASGATVFIEPMETLRISNQIQNLKIEERQEIIRILKFLSGLVREVRDDIFFGLENLGEVDFILAKARLARQMQASEPEITTQPRLHLLQARHPILLQKMGHQHVVPTSLSIGENFHTLVITGPNAGGKTVTLKTVGLMVIMTQLGLHIPAQPDSLIPLPDAILVDIGDRQSLDQDLSTFSAHIIRLRDILQQATPHTLVLVDEIGTGTDPREGSALAIAFLKELTRRPALTLATTHHGELKAFAYATEGVENASMEFDLETLQPTYRLQVGIPGSSYAFEIARRFGFPENVLREAESIVGTDKGALEDLILNLNRQLQEVERERRELSIKLSEAEGLRQLYQAEMERLKREKTRLKREAAEEAEQLLKEARAEIERLVAEIRQRDAHRDTIRQARETLSNLQSRVQTVLKETAPPTEVATDLHRGDVIWVENLQAEGEILSEPDSKNRAWVQVGNVKMKMKLENVKKLRKPEAEDHTVLKSHSPINDELEEGILPELDLRGMDSYQALEETDRYLDRALEEGWSEVRIIHGKGTGTLRRKVNEFLARDKRVEEKRLGRWGEGDTGVTIVKLKRD